MEKKERKKIENRKVKKEKNMRIKERKKRIKREKRSGKKDMRGMNQVKEKIKCKEGCHIVERRNFHSFSYHVQFDNEDVIGAP
jgi:hypothetical protein